MKTIKILSIVYAICISFSLNAQFKVMSNNDTYLPNGNSYWIGSTSDNGYRLRMHMISSYGGFIDYYNYLYFRTGATNSSIKTMILGANGNVSLGYQDPATSGYKLYIQGNVYCTGSYLPSDSSFKNNISIISGALDKIKQLEGVEYNYDAAKLYKYSTKPKPTENDSISLLDNENVKLFQDIEKQRRIGFIGQDFEKVFPECVKKDNNLIAINYTDLIPVLVEAIKEQQKQIDGLKEIINNKSNKLKSFEINDVTGVDVNNATDHPILLQNAPNPFSQVTKIEYYLPESVFSAKINIYNLEGIELKSFKINQKGNGYITIDGKEMKAGIYLYNLIADGKEIETKRMILTR